MTTYTKKFILLFAAVSLHLFSIGIELSAQNFDFDDFFEEAPNLETEFIEARMYMITGQFDEAESRLNDLLTQDPDNGIFLYELARTYEALGEREKALEAAQNAHRNEPANEWILQLLANIATQLERDDLAEDAYRKLLDIHPHRSNYAISRAYHLLLLSDRKEALNVLDNTERIIGVTPELSAKKISIYRADGDADKIEKEYRNLLKAFPQNSSYRMELVDFFLVTNQEEKAKSELEKVLSIDARNSRAQVLLARLEGSAEEDPLTAIYPIISNPTIDADEKIRELIPFLIQLSEKYDQALSAGLSKASKTLTELHPDRAETMALAGDVAFSSYQFLTAKKYYLSALEIRTNVVQVWFNYLESLLRLRNYEQLQKETERALEYYPNQALFYYYISRAHAGIGDLDLASSAFSRANLMSRRQAGLGVYVVLAEAELELMSENISAAYEIVEKGVSDFGPEPDLLLTKARILTHYKEENVQLGTILNQLEVQVPKDPDYLILRALYLHRTGDENEAVALMDRVREYDFYNSKHVLEAALKVYSNTRPDTAEEIKQQLNRFP
jgi:predicted Zn-dependent protease